MEKKGLFITLEGGDGSGKTTVLKEVVARLHKVGYDVAFTREPGGSKISEEIRNIILDKKNTEMDAKTEALLYAASRRQHLSEIVLPLLKQGKVVISDRYVDSSLAYQGYARGLGIDEVLKINMFAIDNKMPDATIYFDIKPEQGLKRIALSRGKDSDRLDNETLAFHTKVHEGYEILKKRFADRYVIIDASKPLKEVEDDVYAIVLSKIQSYLGKEDKK
jgi:dTMP kinase